MRHSDKVLATMESSQSAARSRIAASWRRSMERHGLDPATQDIPVLETASELNERQERAGLLRSAATSQLDHLFSLVGSSGCTVVLTDTDGVILDQRCSDADAPYFASWGLQAGANWSEHREGTNGIGTCLVEERHLIVHRDQHFMAKNTAMSCIDSPIYGANGELVGALDVSSARADQTEGFNKLISATVAQTARQIEAETFRSTFSKDRIVIAGESKNEQNALVAVNGDDVIVGATRAARKLFGWKLSGTVTPVAATDLFVGEGTHQGFERGEKAALVKAITRAGGNMSEAAKALGIGRATLYRRMKRLGLARDGH
ncbi:MAG: helix-turn-helix domain-containing protein [Pseudomonadota bacterium]|nr:helix-turn-helix domain-containing protein [Pseudomonadota bacterium]